jgi:hypothetical protein
VIRELQREDASVAQDWSGWSLNLVNTAGFVVDIIDLGSVA